MGRVAMGSARIGVRNACASMMRTLPPFRGKGRIGDSLARRLTDFSSDDECVFLCPMRNGTKMWIDIRSQMEKWTLWTGSYSEMEELECFLALVEPGMTILDVGANIGFFSVAVGTRLGDNGTLIAIEPMSQNLAALRKNIAVNGLENIDVVGCGVGAEPGEFEMDIGSATSTGNAYVKWTESMPFDVVTEKVPVYRLDDLVVEKKLSQIDLIKIDIEGFELFAFQGATQILSESRPVIMTELNRPSIRTYGNKVSDIVGLFERFDYVLGAIQGKRLVPFSDAGADPDSISSLMVVPTERLDAIQERLSRSGWDVALARVKKESLS
jgi:FkbM family methyltransferase